MISSFSDAMPVFLSRVDPSGPLLRRRPRAALSPSVEARSAARDYQCLVDEHEHGI
jgi:hypothetical protein